MNEDVLPPPEGLIYLSPCLTSLSDSEPIEPLTVDGNSSESEEDEEEGDRGRGGEVGTSEVIPKTPDQEAFLREHFVTLADLSSSGTGGTHSLTHNLKTSFSSGRVSRHSFCLSSKSFQINIWCQRCFSWSFICNPVRTFC